MQMNINLNLDLKWLLVILAILSIQFNSFGNSNDNKFSSPYSFDTLSYTSQGSSIKETPLKTYTQGSNEWGTSSITNSVGAYITSNFESVFPNGITIGSSSRKLILTTSSAVGSFLPSTDKGNVLPTGTLTNPGIGYDNELAGELIAAKLNVGFDEYDEAFANPTRKLKDMFCNMGSSAFKGKTIAELIIIADNIIGGTVTSTQDKIDELSSILKKFNEFYSPENSHVGKTYFVSEMQSLNINNEGGFQQKGIVVTENDNNEISIYPNPAKYEFVAQINSTSNCFGTMKLVDLAGNIISEEPVYIIEGDNFFKVDLLNKSIKASMVIVEFKCNNDIKRNIVIVK